jgi:hypothetical protein
LSVIYGGVLGMSSNAHEENNRTHFTMRRLRKKPDFKVRLARGGTPLRRSWFFSEAAQKEEGRK